MAIQTGSSKFLLLFAVIAAGAYYFVLSGNNNSQLNREQIPCSKTLTLYIGEIDNRYAISETELGNILAEVAALWSEAAGQEVFSFSDEGDIAVNLVYSEDQARSSRERQHSNRIENMRVEISLLEREFNQTQARYDEDISDYNSDARSLQADMDALSSFISRRNEQGGFSEQEARQLEERQHRIDNRVRELDLRRVALNGRAEELSRQLIHLNNRISEKNRAIEEYNRAFSGTRRFTQGSYEWQGAERRINIFHFIDNRELRLVLAHETGHALGIDHVENSESVMYHLMGNQNTNEIILSLEDRAALQNICGSNGKL